MSRNHFIIALVVVISFAAGLLVNQPIITIVGLLGIVSVVMGKALANINKL